MKDLKVLAAAVLAAAVVAEPSAHATVVKVLAAGSSAQWQTAALGAFNSLAGAGAQHFTVKGTCTGTNNCAQVADSRSASIVPQTGNLWIVWNASQTQVWAYMNVDSIVGMRIYFATGATGVRATTLQLDPMVQTGVASGNTNLIASSLWGLDVAAVPSAVYTALNNHIITTGVSDVRAEDAKFENCRVLNPLTSTVSGMGYGTLASCGTQVGTQVESAFSTAFSQPVNFNIRGKDPITGGTIRAFTTVDVGAGSMVYIVNRTNPNGLGYGGATPTITDLSHGALQAIFSGHQCDTNVFSGDSHDTVPPADVPLTAVLREPVSGTMTTHEFTNIRCGNPSGSCTGGTVASLSQESNVGAPIVGSSSNPLNLACISGGGKRMRAIGTGELVGTGVLNTKDSIGYTFFSYGNVSKIAGSASYGYLTLDGVDPINASYTNNGQLPVCTSSAGSGICPAAPGTTFPNLRNGTYRSWSVLRMMTDASGANLTNTKALVSAILANINSTVPDWVPFKAVGGDPGLKYYRSHYLQSGIAANNGLSGQKETGGDVGGCIEPVGPAPGVLSCHQ